MKKKIIVLVIVALVATMSILLIKISNNYNKNFDSIQKLNQVGFYGFILSNYYSYGYLPSNMKELSGYYSEIEFKTHYKDLLSKRDCTIIYYPIYNENNIRDSYIIVSAGIDGKIDNTFNTLDTVHKNELYTRFKFYNLEEDMNLPSPFSIDTVYNKFKILNYFFGKKDYLICYVDAKKIKIKGGKY